MEECTAGIGRPRSATPIDAAWRLALRLGFQAACVWWSVRRPSHQGVQAVITLRNRLLLVRSSYRPEWGLPGGGVRAGETARHAMDRELQEELGIGLPALTPAGSASGIWDGRRDTVQFFTAQLEGLPEMRWDNREIIGARLFAPEELAGLRVTGPVRAYLAGYCAG